MPSINRSTYMTPVQRGTMPGGYDMGPGGAIIEFDNIQGLHRRRGKRPLYEDLIRRGCTPTGQRTGPPGFESDVYNCPGTQTGQPAWQQPKQDWFSNKSVFDGLGSMPAPVVWGALGIAALAAVLYVWPERKVRMY